MSVPALVKGLRILEMTVKGGGVRFSDVCREFEFPKASAARFLNELLELSYLEKDSDSGRYLPGRKLADLFTYQPLPDRLLRIGSPFIDSLRDATGNTVLLVYWDGGRTQIIGKASHPGSVAMQDLGQIRDDLLFYPWGWIFHETLKEDDKDSQRLNSGLSLGDIKIVEDGLTVFRKTGYVFEKEARRGGCSRFAAPIYLNDEIVGALGMGLVKTGLRKNEVREFGEKIRSIADSISDLLIKKPIL